MCFTDGVHATPTGHLQADQLLRVSVVAPAKDEKLTGLDALLTQHLTTALICGSILFVTHSWLCMFEMGWKSRSLGLAVSCFVASQAGSGVAPAFAAAAAVSNVDFRFL